MNNPKASPLLNQELARCWRPFASQFGEQLITKLSQVDGISAPLVLADLTRSPELLSIPDPSLGGSLVLALPGDEEGWSIHVAGYARLPDPIGHRAITIRISKVRIIATIGIAAPRDGDPRPRIESAAAFDLSATAKLDVEIDGVGSVLSLEFSNKTGYLLYLEDRVTVLGQTVAILVSVSKPYASGVVEVAARLGPFAFRRPISVMGAYATVLAGGLPRRWPPAEADQPVTPFPDDSQIYSSTQLSAEAGRTRSQILDTHQTSGVLTDTFEDPSTHLGGYCGNEDSAIWTGHLLAADALNDDSVHISKTLLGIERLFDVPLAFAKTTAGIPDDDRLRKVFPRDLLDVDGVFARCVLPIEAAKRVYKPFGDPVSATSEVRPPEDSSEPFTLSDFAYYRDVDAPDTAPDRAQGRHDHPPTRDQLMGITLGLACTLRFASDTGLARRAAALAVRLANRLDRDGWTILTPAGKITHPAATRPCTARDTLILHHSMQLAVMRVAATADHPNFSGRYAQLTEAYAETLWLMPWVDTLDALGPLYPVNLHHAAYAVLMILEGDPDLRARYAAIGRYLEAASAHHGNPYFDLLRLLSVGNTAALTAPPSHPRPYFNASTLEQGLLMALSDAASRRDIQTMMPRQANPTDQRYLIPAKRDDPQFFHRDGSTYRALFPVPVSQRPGWKLDFAWQRSPFVELPNGQYPRDRGSVTSPGLDLVLPTAALNRLRVGVSPPPVSGPPSPIPPQPSLALGTGSLLALETKDALAGIVHDIQVLKGFLDVIHSTPSLPDFLRSRFREFCRGSDGDDPLQQIIDTRYGSATVAARDHGVLIADALFALEGQTRGAEFYLLEAFRPTIQKAWGRGGKAFEEPLDPTESVLRDRLLLLQPIRAIFPVDSATIIAAELTSLPELAPIRAPSYFADPDLSLGQALREVLLVTESR